MNTNRRLMLLGVAALGCATATAWLYMRLDTERTRAAALEARIAELEQGGLASVSATTRSTVSPKAAVAAASSFANARLVPEESPSVHAVVESRQERLKKQQAMLQTPEYQNAIRSQRRASLRRRYVDVAQELSLSQEQVTQLLNLLEDQQMRTLQNDDVLTFEMMMADATWGVALAKVGRRSNESEQRDRVEIAQLLGNDALARWDDYRNAEPARNLERDFAGLLEDTSAPLRAEQREALRKALAQVSVNMQQEAQAMLARFQQPGSLSAQDQMELMEAQAELATRTHERQRQAVAPLLSAHQMKELIRLQERDESALTAQNMTLQIQLAQPNKSGGGNGMR